MKIGRIGLVSLIIGLIILMNASSSHVSGIITATYGILSENDTQHYIILTAPVGNANLSIGLHPPRTGQVPPGFDRYNLVNIPVYMEFCDPFNQTLAVQDIVTPYSFDVIFKTRGFYSIYVTNKGTENSTIPVSVEFQQRNPQNIEADKYFLSIILTSLGAILVSMEWITKFISKQRKQEQHKNDFQK